MNIKNRYKRFIIHIKLFTYGIKNYTINEDLSINVQGNVVLPDMDYKKLTKIPFTFRKVTGNFVCSHNYFESLEGCPIEVAGNFSCEYTNVSNLKGGPKVVHGFFNCDETALYSLEGGPKYIGGSFSCCENKIENFIGGPESVGGNYVVNNTHINSIEGFCCRLQGNFYHNCNELKTSTISEQLKEQFKYKRITELERFYKETEVGISLEIEGNILHKVLSSQKLSESLENNLIHKTSKNLHKI